VSGFEAYLRFNCGSRVRYMYHQSRLQPRYKEISFSRPSIQVSVYTRVIMTCFTSMESCHRDPCEPRGGFTTPQLTKYASSHSNHTSASHSLADILMRLSAGGATCHSWPNLGSASTTAGWQNNDLIIDWNAGVL